MQNKRGMPCEVFISHSTKDGKIAGRIVETLEANGIGCWISSREIEPGTPNYGAAIIESINACSIMVVLLTKAANESAHVVKEVALATDRRMLVLTFRAEAVQLTPGMEYFLSLPQSLDATTPPIEPRLKQLVEIVLKAKGRELTTIIVPYHRDWRRIRRWLAAAAVVLLLAGGFLWWRLSPKGTLSFNTDPPDALITSQGKEIGHTPFLNYKVPAGPQHFEISKDGFVQQPVDFTVKRGDNFPVNVKLRVFWKAMDDSLTISSEPTQAAILDINGTVVGQTPWSGPVPVDGQSKTQNYELALDGYAPNFVGTLISPGEKRTLDPVKLTPMAPAAAGKDWYNSLGMKFIDCTMPGRLVSTCETRVRDFAAFISETGYDAGKQWNDPGFSQVPNCPVVRVSWDDAMKFCEWLTLKERKLKLIGPAAYYRLPTDTEWSNLADLYDEVGATPEEKSDKVKDRYPWGTQWPPPVNAGNYSGKDKGIYDVKLPANYDGYPDTAPVGSFPGQSGVYDLDGNAMEWCMDWSNTQKTMKVKRGSNFMNDDQTWSLTSHREYNLPNVQSGGTVFRCLLVLDPSLQPKDEPLADYTPPTGDQFVLAPTTPAPAPAAGTAPSPAGQVGLEK